jgi:hypothetical protein
MMADPKNETAYTSRYSMRGGGDESSEGKSADSVETAPEVPVVSGTEVAASRLDCGFHVIMSHREPDS